MPYLELAVYEGEYYVSFPPLPSVILWPLTFLFGMATPDNLLVKLYALGACLMMYAALKRAGYSRISAGLFAFFFCFASSMLPMTLDGAVWYHAQVLAFFLTTASICLMTMDRLTLSLLCYALAVACRPFSALYAAPLFFTYFSLHRRAGISHEHSPVYQPRAGRILRNRAAPRPAVQHPRRHGPDPHRQTDSLKSVSEFGKLRIPHVETHSDPEG